MHQGFIVSGKRHAINSPLMTQVEKLADDGQMVEAGEVIAELGVSKQRDNLAEKLAEIEVTGPELEKLQGLAEMASETAWLKVRKARLLVEQRRHEWEKAQKKRDWTKILETEENQKVLQREIELTRRRQDAQNRLNDKGYAARSDLLKVERDLFLLECEEKHGKELLPWLNNVGEVKVIFQAGQALQQASHALFLAELEARAETARQTLAAESKRHDRDELASTVEDLRREIASAVITAPVAGTILREKTYTGVSMEKIREGDQVFPGLSFLAVLDTSRMGVEFFVDQRDAAGLREGAQITFRPDAFPEFLLPGTVVKFGKTAEDGELRLPGIDKVVKAEALLTVFPSGPLLGFSGTVELAQASAVPDVSAVPRAYMQRVKGAWLPVSGYSAFSSGQTPLGWDDSWVFFAGKPEKITLPPRTLPLSRKKIARKLELPGEVQSRKRSILAPGFGGRVASVNEDGTTVKKGETLAKLDVSELEKTLTDQEIQIRTMSEQLELLREKNRVELPRFEQKRRNAENALKTAEVEHEMLLHRRDEDAIINLQKTRELIEARIRLLQETLELEKNLSRRGLKSEIDLLTTELEILRRQRDGILNKDRLEYETSGPGYRQVEISRLAMAAAGVDVELAAIEEKSGRFSAMMEERILAAGLARLSSARDRQKTKIAAAAIVSPLDGMVILPEIHTSGQISRIKAGDQVHEGFPFLHVVDPADLEIKLDVPEIDVKFLHPGKPVRMTLKSAPGKVFAGSIARIGFAANYAPQTRPDSQVEVFIGIASGSAGDPAFRPGATCEVIIDLHEGREDVVVPMAAVIPTPDGPRVMDRNGKVISIASYTLDPAHGLMPVSGVTEGEHVRIPDFIPWEVNHAAVD
jgi:multidrug resistance efflux pump